jgi:hypothetical protein
MLLVTTPRYLLGMNPIASIREQLKEYLKGFDPDVYSEDDVAELVVMFADIERSGAAGKLMAARRVEKIGLHEREGHRQAASWLASLTGESVGQAASHLETARRAEAHLAVREAFRSGAISEAQTKEIVSAADRSPSLARDLVAEAPWLDFGQLKKRCREVPFADSSEADEIARHEKIRKTRFCRTWVDAEGAGHLQAQMTADALAVVRSKLGEFEKQVFCEARKAGTRENGQAYLADALVAMAQCSIPQVAGSDEPSTDRAASGVSKPLVRIRVDLEALLRGHAIAGEVCAIPGFGPVPVALARELLGDAILELVVTRGTDVTTVCSDSRYVRKALRIALQERDPVCVVPECQISDPLERDHWRTGFADDGPTRLDNLVRLCSWHHHQKHYRGWKLEGGPGRWRFVKPPDPPPPGASPPDSEPSEPKEPTLVGARRARHRAASGADPPIQSELL